MEKKVESSPKFCIITNNSYGIYAGIVQSYDPVTKIVEATELRHIPRWFGKTGGITSLAAHGICGPRVEESRIGAAVSSGTVSNVANIFECSAEARASFEAAKQS